MRLSLPTALPALLYCCVHTASGQGLPPASSGATILHNNITYQVEADGRFAVEELQVVRIDSDAGIKSFAQIPLPYSASLQELDVLEAYTTGRDGQRLDVAPEKILVQQSRQSAEAPLFDDGKVKNVVFPAVEVGVTLTLRMRKVQKQPLFPGHFSIIEAAACRHAYGSLQVTIKAPRSLMLHVDAIDMIGGRVDTGNPALQTWQWSTRDQPARPVEIGSVGAMDHCPRVAVTTFPGHDAAAAAYLARAQPASAVTPRIQKLADEITAGLTDKRAQAEAVYRWVSRNIRYVAIFLESGGVVPHSADAIAEARYGDCKDHATLLEALLAAKGIRSSPVLVNTGDVYWLPKVAVSPGVFNHAISYLPDFKTFVDSTAGVAMFGVLPVTQQGKPALVTNDGSGKATIVTLPQSQPEADRVRVETQLVVDAEGHVSGTSVISTTGLFDWISRQIFVSIPPAARPQVAGRMLTLTGQSGTGSFEVGDVRDLAVPLTYRTEFKLPGYAQVPGPAAMAAPRGLDSFSSIAASFDLFSLERRQLPMPFVSRRVDEVITVRLPQAIRPASMPKPVRLSSTLGSYESHYDAVDQVVTIKRRLEIRVPGALLDPLGYKELKALGAGVMRDLRAQWVY